MRTICMVAALLTCASGAAAQTDRIAFCSALRQGTEERFGQITSVMRDFTRLAGSSETRAVVMADSAIVIHEALAGAKFLVGMAEQAECGAVLGASFRDWLGRSHETLRLVEGHTSETFNRFILLRLQNQEIAAPR